MHNLLKAETIMILLNKSEFRKVLEPLQKVTINYLFASAVVKGHIKGTIYVDNQENPRSYYVTHPYGMSLLFGDNTNEEFNGWLLDHALNTFQIRDRYEWLQAFPETWNEQITTQWGEHILKSNENDDGLKNSKIEVNTRVNFKFNETKYCIFKNMQLFSDIKVYQTNQHMFDSMQGSVIPSRFWNNSNDFRQRAIAFSVLVGDVVVSTAFSAFIEGKQLEIGIETSPLFRGRGYAITTCLALIDYCLENDLEPIWACRLENSASYLLAQKLGFEPIIYWPFYRLND